MADPTPSNGIQAIAQAQRETKERVSEVESPTGTQYDRTVAKVFALFAQLDQQVADAIAANSYTKSQLDNPTTGKAPVVHTHPVADVTGTWNKPVENTTTVKTGDIYATQAPGYNITGTRVAAWWQTADGRGGTASSSEKYKTQISEADIDPRKILQAMPVWYRYKEAIEYAEYRRSCPAPLKCWNPEARAPQEVGMIAERLHELGLWAFVVYLREDDGMTLKLDADGEAIPDGIHYPNWSVALQVVVRYLDERITRIEDRLDAAGI